MDIFRIFHHYSAWKPWNLQKMLWDINYKKVFLLHLAIYHFFANSFLRKFWAAIHKKQNFQGFLSWSHIFSHRIFGQIQIRIQQLKKPRIQQKNNYITNFPPQTTNWLDYSTRCCFISTNLKTVNIFLIRLVWLFVYVNTQMYFFMILTIIIHSDIIHKIP